MPKPDVLVALAPRDEEEPIQIQIVDEDVIRWVVHMTIDQALVLTHDICSAIEVIKTIELHNKRVNEHAEGSADV